MQVTRVEGLRVALLGATGSVGGEILGLLDERRFPVRELLPLASPESEGDHIEFRGEEYRVESADDAERLAGCDLIFAAAPSVLEPLLPDLRHAKSALIDVSGALELDLSVPLWLAGWSAPLRFEPDGPRWVAIPRGVSAGLGLTLGPLACEAGLERVTVLTLESASGVGRSGTDELGEHTIQLLNAMSGDVDESAVFPLPLAFDCLPQVGALLEDGDSGEERRLGHVLRRLLGGNGWALETTRTRVPIFAGSLALVHVQLAKDVSPARARELWAASEGVSVLPDEALPTPRSVLGRNDVVVGRVRRSNDQPGRLAFAVAQDDLRRGGAFGAVCAAEAIFRAGPGAIPS